MGVMMTDLVYTCKPERGGGDVAELAAHAVDMEQGRVKDSLSFAASTDRTHWEGHTKKIASKSIMAGECSLQGPIELSSEAIE